MRKIIHVDMDAFFASIEQRDNEEFRGKPLVVGYPGDRGVIAAASYEARKYGVYSAMSSKVALRKCPFLIFTPSRFDVYKVVSDQIMDIFHEYTDMVEPLSLDEAFLDVTQNHKNIQSATQIAQEIKDKILEQTQLTASAGIYMNKFLAKIASDYNKPNGLCIIRPKHAEAFVESLKIEKFYGVGKVTAKRMYQLGIKTGWDLKQRTELDLISAFGKVGSIYFQNARGIDNRQVETDRIRKSVGAEITFLEDLSDMATILEQLGEVAKDVINRIEDAKFEGRTITLKVRYPDFRTFSRSKTLNTTIHTFDLLYNIASELLASIDVSPKIRLLGLTVKNNDEVVWRDAIQLSIDFDKHNRS